MSALTALFLAALVAATLLPAQSELVLAGLLLTSEHSPWVLVAVASLGNVLGSLINFALGRFLSGYAGRRWFPFTPGQIARGERFYARWGWWSLFGSWLPLVGDPITFIAGMLKEPLWRFVLIVTLAKTGRYALLTLAVLQSVAA